MIRDRRVGALVLAGLILLPIMVVAVRGFGPHPPLARPVVLITTPWPGAMPADVERSVTIPLEQALVGVHGVAGQSSVSLSGSSSVRLELARDASELVVRQEVMERLRAPTLPPGTSPVLSRGGSPTLTFALVGDDDTSLESLRSIADWDVQRELRQIPGVSDVLTCGGRERRIEIQLDPRRLRDLGVRPTDAVDAIAMHARGKLTHVDMLKTIPVSDGAGKAHTIDDVAAVMGGQRTADCIATGKNGEVAIAELTLQPGADVATVALDVNARLVALKGRFPLRIVPLEMEKQAPFVHVHVWAPPGERDTLAALVRALPEAAEVYARSTEDETELLVRCAPKLDAVKLARAIARSFETRPDNAYDLTSPQVEMPRELRVARLRVLGPDLSSSREVAQQLVSALQNTPGLSHGVVPDARRIPHVTVTPDRSAMARLGVTADAPMRAFGLASEGEVVGSFVDGTRRFDVVVLMSKTGHLNDDLASLTVPVSDGTTVPLSALATIRLDESPWRISRAAGARYVDVLFDTRDESAFNAARTAATKVRIPPGVAIELSREGD